MALTRSETPPEIETLILGQAMAKGPAERVAQLPPALLAASIDVFLGTQPFWWLGLQHRNEASWAPVIDHLAAHPNHPMGRRCMNNLVRHEELKRLMAALPAWADCLDDLFEMLVLHRLGSSGGRALKRAWEAIFEKATPAQAVRWRERLASLAPGIVDGLLEFRDELGLDFTETPELFGPLRFDLRALELVINIKKLTKGRPDLMVIALDGVAEAIKTNPPILFGTYDYIRDAFLTPEQKDHSFFKELAALRSSVLQVRFNQRDAEAPEEPVIDNDHWIGRM